MDKYFYLITQLPGINFDEPAPITLYNFLEEAKKWLTQKHFRTLKRVIDGEIAAASSSALSAFKAFSQSLQNDIYQYRLAKRRQQDYKPVVVPAHIFKIDNPLEREKHLMKLQWDFLDNLASDHHFDIEAVIIYALKLKILERLKQFDKQQGAEIYQSISKRETNIELKVE
jgi:hypothetical protein